MDRFDPRLISLMIDVYIERVVAFKRMRAVRGISMRIIITTGTLASSADMFTSLAHGCTFPEALFSEHGQVYIVSESIARYFLQFSVLLTTR